MLGLPILEGVLIGIWTSAPAGTGCPAGWALLVVAIFHLAIGTLVLAGQGTTPQTALAKAIELEECFETQKSELQRREIAYRLVREAFDLLNLQTCSIEEEAYNHIDSTRAGSGRDPWCLGGFCQGLMPVLKPFIDRMDVTLGVKSMQFTLEAWFRENVVSVRGQVDQPKNGLIQHVYYGSHVDHCVGVCLEANRSPCCLGDKADKAYQQHIKNNEELFFEDGHPKDEIYFRQYAVCPITWSCSGERMGILVLTSMQDEPFADDVLDTMAFFGTLITNYHAAYEECYMKYSQRKPGQSHPKK